MLLYDGIDSGVLSKWSHGTAQRFEWAVREVRHLRDVNEVVIGDVVDDVGDGDLADSRVNTAKLRLLRCHAIE